MDTLEKVDDLLSKMTLKEKIGQLNQSIYGWKAFSLNRDEVILSDEFKKEVAFGDGLGALYGVSRIDGWNCGETDGLSPRLSAKVANALQKYVIENTRLGIPLLLSEECPHGHVALKGTTYPVNIAIGSTWNPDLYEIACSQMGREVRARGAHLGLISTLDMAVDPRWGRTEECYGEDPLLASRFCEKAVTGLQGNSDEDLRDGSHVAAVVKHFCGQGAAVGGHNGKSTTIGPRELREIHLPAMKKAVEAGALSCMAAYNDIDGLPCHFNKDLLTGILRKEMGFGGFVMSDGMGVDSLIPLAGDRERAGARALKAGVDMNLWNQSYLQLEPALEKELLSIQDIDRAVRRILNVKFKLGLFDNPYVQEESAASLFPNRIGRHMALELAREGSVLLKNDGVLPLDSRYRKIAVIGPNSHSVYNMLGDYAQIQEKGKVSTILDGIGMFASSDTEILRAEGCSVRGAGKEGFSEALEAAKRSDLSILVLGGSSSRESNMSFNENGAVALDRLSADVDCGEGVDLADLKLGGVQEDLAETVIELGKPVVVILIQGRPHAVPGLAEKANALLCGWYPGERGGEAIGEILFGKACPSGRLSVSVPRSSAQLPVSYNRKDQGDYRDMKGTPLYPFGFGLSYTTFRYDDFSINSSELSINDLKSGTRFQVDFTVENTGGYDGKETAQLYIRDLEASTTRRLKELKDFTKVKVLRGEKKSLSLTVGLEELSVYNEEMDFLPEPGRILLMVGSSSEDILFEEIVLITG